MILMFVSAAGKIPHAGPQFRRPDVFKEISGWKHRDEITRLLGEIAGDPLLEGINPGELNLPGQETVINAVKDGSFQVAGAFYPENASVMQTLIRNALKQGLSVQLFTQDGSLRPVLSNAFPIVPGDSVLIERTTYGGHQVRINNDIYSTCAGDTGLDIYINFDKSL